LNNINNSFIRSILTEFNTTNDSVKSDRETIRAEMWWQLARKFIFGDYIETKKDTSTSV